MAGLEASHKGATDNGALPNQPVTVIYAAWFGTNCVQITYRDAFGSLSNEPPYRDSEGWLELVIEGLRWRFDGEVGGCSASMPLKERQTGRIALYLSAYRLVSLRPGRTDRGSASAAQHADGPF